MNKDFEALKPYLDKEMALSTALGLFEWDNETEAPKEAVERTAKVIGIISGEVYSAIMNDEVKRLRPYRCGESYSKRNKKGV